MGTGVTVSSFHISGYSPLSNEQLIIFARGLASSTNFGKGAPLELCTMFLIFPIFAKISVYPVLSIFLLVLVFTIFSYLPSDPYFTDIP